jgi:hypothetical protein
MSCALVRLSKNVDYLIDNQCVPNNIVSEGMRSRRNAEAAEQVPELGNEKCGGEAVVLAQNHLRLSPF